MNKILILSIVSILLLSLAQARTFDSNILINSIPDYYENHNSDLQFVSGQIFIDNIENMHDNDIRTALNCSNKCGGERGKCILYSHYNFKKENVSDVNLEINLSIRTSYGWDGAGDYIYCLNKYGQWDEINRIWQIEDIRYINYNRSIIIPDKCLINNTLELKHKIELSTSLCTHVNIWEQKLLVGNYTGGDKQSEYDKTRKNLYLYAVLGLLLLVGIIYNLVRKK